MAQDKVPTLAAPVKTERQAKVESPYYDADNLPEKCNRTARWLLQQGWKCLGEPDWPEAEWYVPGAVDREISVRVAKKGYVWRHTGKVDAMGRPIAEQVEEVLHQQDGSHLGVLNVPVMQLRVTPPSAPMSFRQAVQVQRLRDESARQAV